MNPISLDLVLIAGLLLAAALLAVVGLLLGRAIARLSGCRCGRGALRRTHHHPSCPERTLR